MTTPDTKTTLTDKECQMLLAIWTNQFHDGGDKIEFWVWTDDVCDPFGTSAGGIVASCVKKELVLSSQHKNPHDNCLTITRRGAQALLSCQDIPDWIRPELEAELAA